MTNSLTPNQKSALGRALEHRELLPILYRKVEKLYWFDVFTKVGLLLPENNPPPKPAKDEGFFQIPAWPITMYLVKTSPLLKEPDNKEYAIKFRNLLRDVTAHSKKEKFGNYRTWSQFSKIIRNIPIELLENEDIEQVQYWLTDRFGNDIIGETLGEWLLDLFKIHSLEANNISLKLLDFLYEITYVEKSIGNNNNMEAVLLLNSYGANKLTERISKKAAESIGQQAIDLFRHKIEDILNVQKDDTLSSMWRPAIEEHNQNLGNHDAADIILKAFRESIIGLFEYNKDVAEKYITELLDSKFQTLIRVAIFAIDKMFTSLNDKTTSKVINLIYFKDNYRHELWNLLANRFVQFSDKSKTEVLKIIDNLSLGDENGNYSEGIQAYQKSIWLSAICEKDDRAKALYDKYLETIKDPPEHPDFSSYISSGWVDHHKSPIELETLRSLEYASLVITLNEYKGGQGYREPGIDGLASAFKELVKLDAYKLYKDLDKFINLNIPYVHPLIEAFLELWKNGKEAHLPWNNIWPKLLSYVDKVISKVEFWEQTESREDGAFVANRHGVIGTIGRLIEAGCKSDDHSFDVHNIELSKNILYLLLEKETGAKFNLDSDAISISINSSRGHCLEAIINLAWFTCKNHEKIGINPLEAWEQFQKIFDLELKKSSNGEYEFATLVAYYLHNFMYLSEEWTMKNLSNIFNQTEQQRWLCAIQGYSYVKKLNPRIYNFLRENGNIIKTLDDKNLSDYVHKRYIQFITLAYLSDSESLSDPKSQISILLKRAKQTELTQLIWFLLRFRKNIDDKLRSKVYELWPLLLNVIDKNTTEGQNLASQMCNLSLFIDKIDEERKSWLMTVAPYAEMGNCSNDLLEAISRLSLNDPFDIKDIWLAMLSEDSFAYPEDVIKQALRNFLKKGKKGEKAAKKIVGEYLKHGEERPRDWLNEISP